MESDTTDDLPNIPQFYYPDDPGDPGDPDDPDDPDADDHDDPDDLPNIATLTQPKMGAQSLPASILNQDEVKRTEETSTGKSNIEFNRISL